MNEQVCFITVDGGTVVHENSAIALEDIKKINTEGKHPFQIRLKSKKSWEDFLNSDDSINEPIKKKAAQPARKSQFLKNPKIRIRVAITEILTKNKPTPMSIPALVKALSRPKDSIRSALKTLIKNNKVEKVSNMRPFAYQLKNPTKGTATKEDEKSVHCSAENLTIIYPDECVPAKGDVHCEACDYNK